MGQYESVTDEDRKVVQRVWPAIQSDLMAYGAALFNVIFTDYPLMANYFPFSGPDDDKFEQHAKGFMFELDKLARNIDKPKELKKILVENGVNHASRNIDSEQYLRMRKSFLKAVVTKMGARNFGSTENRVFDKLLTLAMNEIMDSSNKERVKRGVKRV